jgi:hypothetical protein
LEWQIPSISRSLDGPAAWPARSIHSRQISSLSLPTKPLNQEVSGPR